MHYISRTVNAIENLIWYSESTINSLSCTSHQIFAYLSSLGCNFTEKMANFHAFFGWSLLNILTTTWKILMKLAQKWDKMNTNQMVWDSQAPVSPIPSKLTWISGWSNVVLFKSRGSTQVLACFYKYGVFFGPASNILKLYLEIQLFAPYPTWLLCA